MATLAVLVECAFGRRRGY